MREIYLDNSATTPMCDAALDTFLRVSREAWGNPSSLHAVGNTARHELAAARDKLLRALDARGGKLVFTGSGSEANNLAIFGRAYAKARYRRGARIITTAGEHASVSMPLAKLRDEGYEVIEIATTGGALDMAQLEGALTKDTVLVSMMLVNNETGAHYDLPAAAALVHRLAPEALFHVDATQAFCKVPFSVKREGYDLLTVSAHKIGGPKGCGALWLSDAVIKSKGLSPQILGGGQEDGFRAGTVDVAGCAAFGEAAAFGAAHRDEHRAALIALSSYLIDRIDGDETLSEIQRNAPVQRAPHIVSLRLPRIKSETMLHFLSGKGISVSSGSACSSHGRHAAPPLAAFGLNSEEADCSIRISFSARNTRADVDALCEALAEGLVTLARIR